MFPVLPDILTGVESISGILGKILDVLLDLLNKIWNGILSIPEAIAELIGLLKDFLGAFSLEGILDAILNLPTLIWELIKEAAQNIVDVLEGISNFLKDIISKLLQGLKELLLLLFVPDLDKMKEAITSLVNLIKDKFPFIAQVAELIRRFVRLKEGDLDLFNFTWFGVTVSIVDFAPFKIFLTGIHLIILALAYYRFARKLYYKLPGLIGAYYVEHYDE